MTAATLERQDQAKVESQPAVPEPQPRGSCGSHRTLFAVPFHSPMSTSDRRRLAAVSGLDCDLFPKLPGTTVSPGLRRLDFASGLFLVRGEYHDEWRLECRTWAGPAAGTVHRWHVWAVAAARMLDSDVPVTRRA